MNTCIKCVSLLTQGSAAPTVVSLNESVLHSFYCLKLYTNDVNATAHIVQHACLLMENNLISMFSWQQGEKRLTMRAVVLLLDLR